MISSSWHRILAAGLLVVGVQTSALASTFRTYAFTDKSQVTVTITHPLHHVEERTAHLLGILKVQEHPARVALPLRVLIPIFSFRSGNRNRDINMLEIMNAARYPDAILEVATDSMTLIPASTSAMVYRGTAQGTLTLRGVTHTVSVPLQVRLGAHHLKVASHFTVELSDYRIPRPSLLMIPIDNTITVDVKGVAKRS